MAKEKRDKRLNLRLTEEEYLEILEEAEKLEVPASTYCVNAIRAARGKVEKLEPKDINVNIAPIDVYKDDLERIAHQALMTSDKIDRLINTLEQRGAISDFEYKKIKELIIQLSESENAVGQQLNNIYEVRKQEAQQVKKEVQKNINRYMKDVLER